MSALPATIQMVGSYGQQSKKAIPFLLEAIKDKSPQVRWSAASALGKMGQHGKEVIPNWDTEPEHRTTRFRREAVRKYPDFVNELPADLRPPEVIPVSAPLQLD